MCVAQFKNYCNTFSHKPIDAINANDIIDHSRGTYYANGRALYYIKNKAKMKQLKKQGNLYALNDTEIEEG